MINKKNSYPPMRTYQETSSLISGRISLQDLFEACGNLGLEEVQGKETFVYLANISTLDSQAILRIESLNPIVRAPHSARAEGS